QALTLSSDGKKVVFRPYGDPNFHVADVTTGKQLRTFERDVGSLSSSGSYSSAQFLHLTPNDRLLVDAGADSAIRVCGLASGRQLRELPSPAGGVYNFALSRDGKKAASTSGNAIYLWDLAEGRQTSDLGHQTSVSRVAFSPDGKYVLSIGSNTL